MKIRYQLFIAAAFTLGGSGAVIAEPVLDCTDEETQIEYCDEANDALWEISLECDGGWKVEGNTLTLDFTVDPQTFVLAAAAESGMDTCMLDGDIGSYKTEVKCESANDDSLEAEIKYRGGCEGAGDADSDADSDLDADSDSDSDLREWVQYLSL